MESKDKLKEIDINNHTCYCFPDTIRFWDRDVEFSDILLDKKLYKEKDESLWDFIHNFNRCKTIAY